MDATSTTTPGAERDSLYALRMLARMRDLRVPGVSVAVARDGQVVDEAVYGVRRAGGSSPVTTTTRFQACSISKPVTVLGLLRLVEQGRLDLDADVNDVMTSWSVPPNGGWQPRLTLRQLASHSAGLTTHGFPGYPRGAALPTLPQVLSGIAPANTEGVRVDIVPGVQFRYSGGGTTVIQLLLEDVTGVPVADLLRELVLEPLGMRHSGYEQPLPEHLHDEAATAHHSDGTPVLGEWHTYPEQCAAGLWTTPADLVRYAVAVQDAVAGRPGALVSQATAEEMLTPQTPPSPQAERIGGLHAVGLGPFVRQVAGRTVAFGHSGGNEGFRCHLMADRDGRIAAAVMTNADTGSRLVLEAFDAIAQEHDWPGFTSEPFDPEPPHGDGLEVFVGSFADERGTPLEVSRTGDRLDVRLGAQAVVVFAATSDTSLASQSVDATLERRDDGCLVLTQSDVETSFRPRRGPA